MPVCEGDALNMKYSMGHPLSEEEKKKRDEYNASGRNEKFDDVTRYFQSEEEKKRKTM